MIRFRVLPALMMAGACALAVTTPISFDKTSGALVMKTAAAKHGADDSANHNARDDRGRNRGGGGMAVDPRTVAAVDKRVVDDWPQCQKGGALYPLIERGDLRDEHIHAEIGQIICGERLGRADPAERILFWHRGFAVSDIVLGSWIVAQARRKGPGQTLTLWNGLDE